MKLGQYTDYTIARCSLCGDSKDPRKGHLAIYPDGKSYCFRCNESRPLSIEALLRIALEQTTIEEEVEDESWENDEYNFSEDQPIRSQVLISYETKGLENFYSFEMKNCNGDIVGWHHRNKKSKEFFNDGRSGLGYEVEQLKSSPSTPLTIVEGPYDVMTNQHVCVFGSLSLARLKQLTLQYIWLFPDPDWIDTVKKRDEFGQLVKKLVEDHMVFVQGVIVGNDDPDKATIIQYIPYEQVVSSWISNHVQFHSVYNELCHEGLGE